MDLERIKQSLRLVSGRSKKSSKETQAQSSSSKPASTPTKKRRPTTATRPNGHSENLYSLNSSVAKSSPQLSAARDARNDDQATRRPLQSHPDAKSTQTRRGFSSRAVSNSVRTAGDKRGKHHKQNVTNGYVAQKIEQQVPMGNSPDSNTMDSPLSEDENFDLQPPAPSPKSLSIEMLSELLSSPEHLTSILYSPVLLRKFTMFLQKYRPQDYPLLMQYLEMSKAIRAVEYANAVAEGASAVPQFPGTSGAKTPSVAAVLDTSFQGLCTSTFDQLVSISLPLYTTYTLVRTISAYLIDEVTGYSTVDPGGTVGGLSEVFCLTDPNQEDSPIIYCSEEFYRLTGYGQDDVIGANCRFLQGAKTNHQSPRRIRESLRREEEISETLLNYRRDGKPFINLLMIAPLHDKEGKVKYNIGAQIDVSQLIENGQVLEGFQTVLRKKEADKSNAAESKSVLRNPEALSKRKELCKLRELSELCDLEESAIISAHSRSTSVDHDEDSGSAGSAAIRRRLGDPTASEDKYDEDLLNGQNEWNFGPAGPNKLSGKLPGVYEKYMLIRPSPSLRIVFVSPMLFKYGEVVQSPFLSHVAAPAGTLSGLVESFDSGIPVVAKINFMPQRSENHSGTSILPSERHQDGKHGRACWISATPLLGGDGRIGVWMIVFIDKAQVKSQRARDKQSHGINAQNEEVKNCRVSKGTVQSVQQSIPSQPEISRIPQKAQKTYDLPIKPRRLDSAIEFNEQRHSTQKVPSAYQYQVATPIEEYRPAEEINKPPSSRTSGLKSVDAAQISTHDVTVGGDNQVLSSTPPKQISPSLNRLRTVPDDDDDKGEADDSAPRTRPAQSINDYNPAAEHGLAPRISDHPPTARSSDHSQAVSALVKSNSPTAVQEENIESNAPLSQTPTPPLKSSLRLLVAIPSPTGSSAAMAEQVQNSPPRTPSSQVRSAAVIGQIRNSPPATPLSRGSSVAPSPPAKKPLPRTPSPPKDRSGDVHFNAESTKSYRTHTARSSATLPAGLGYMDFLRYGNTGRQSPVEVERGRKPRREGEGELSDGTDGDVSPNSVD